MQSTSQLVLYTPFAESIIDNPFGPATGKLLAYYETLGVRGHPGIDYNIAWGTPIPNCYEGAVVSCILSENNPDLMVFRAVNTIVDLEGVSYEIQYGHISTTKVRVGQTLKLGDIVAQIGNTGDVFQETNGKIVEVTAAEKNAGSHVGSHLHFQVRVLNKVPVAEATDYTLHWVNDGSGRLVLNGYCYSVPYYNNGFNGCVDPKPFLISILSSNPTPPPQGLEVAVNVTIGTVESQPTTLANNNIITFLLKLRKILFGY